MKPAILIVVCLVLSAAAWGQPQGSLNNDPKNVKFVTSDIANFWRAYDRAAKETERPLRRRYSKLSTSTRAATA